MATSNVEILARNAYLDGVRLTFRNTDYDRSQQRYYSIIESLADASGMDMGAVTDQVKFRKIPSGKDRSVILDTYFIGGKLARFFSRAGLAIYADSITEMHVKFHLVEEHDNAQNELVDRLWSTSGKFAGTGYTPSHSPRNKRAGGTKGFTVGNPKSDIHVTINKYRGERTGVEGHIKGAVLSRIKEDTRRYRAATNDGRDETVSLSAIFAEAASRSAERFLRALRSRGIVLTDMFYAASYVSWNVPLHEKAVDMLNAEEEHNHVQARETPHIRLSEGDLSDEYSQQDFTDMR